MPYIARSAISCGVYQLYGLQWGCERSLKRIIAGYKRQARRNGRKNGFAQVIWSDADVYECGKTLAEYLRAQFPTSTVVELSAKRSPSTGRNITTYIWNIPHPSLKKHKFYEKTKEQAHDNF
jgi:hypothetical protein